ncbi:hypothetical protein Nepgr_008635 [Nepenthes gracilis]|uniref:Uncharacterized protein n=1 Tax=Nepenthes gracilis TaxID=150966 RepID=A0AAD3XJK6_NEPGR|nr:hypothetical protein Nepgr_008635 [Nepenthes gracilis]
MWIKCFTNFMWKLLDSWKFHEEFVFPPNLSNSFFSYVKNFDLFGKIEFTWNSIIFCFDVVMIFALDCFRFFVIINSTEFTWDTLSTPTLQIFVPFFIICRLKFEVCIFLLGFTFHK